MLAKLDKRLIFFFGTILFLISFKILYSIAGNFTIIIQVDDDELANDQERIDAIDYKYCGGPCRFLNILYLPEQETRSQVHLRHLAFTAGLVNRTLVLPNVDSSRVGACLAHDFSYYYDIQWAKDHSEYFNYITMDDFKAWLIERKEAQSLASSQTVSIVDQDSDSNYILASIHDCFHDLTRPMSSINQVLAWKIKHFIVNGEKNMIKLLTGVEQSQKKADRVEVIQMVYVKGNPFSRFKDAEKVIPYSPDIIQLADKTAKAISPYVAIHWRMETIKRSNNLVECAIDLTQRLDQEPLKGLNAFLLTDYPHRFTEEQQLMASENNATKKELQKWVKSSSTTFHFSAFTPNHHKAIRILYQNHPFILFDSEYHGESSTPDGWNLLPLPADQDSGWLGILDKLMAIRSDQFYAGKPKFCARRSTFTAQIINERFLMDPSRQPIQYFG